MSARDQELQAIGTAPHHQGFLLVEWDLPWPRDPGEVLELAPLRDVLKSTGTRLQLVVPSRPELPDRRVALHRCTGEWFSGFERTERRVPPGEVAAAAHALLEGDPSSADAATDVDVLVCTHGSRDRCCGAQGTILALAVLDVPTAQLRRTSHLGGHRFAPTAVVLPEGTAWAFLDGPVLEDVLTRRCPVGKLARHYRGSLGVRGAGLQALEGRAFAEVGWGWLDLERRGSESDDGTVSLEARSADGTVSAWQARAEVGRRVEIAACGDATKPPSFEDEVVLTDVVRLR